MLGAGIHLIHCLTADVIRTASFALEIAHALRLRRGVQLHIRHEDDRLGIIGHVRCGGLVGRDGLCLHLRLWR